MEEKKCFFCKKMIPKGAYNCPYCHRKTLKGVITKLLITLTIIIGLLLIAFS